MNIQGPFSSLSDIQPKWIDQCNRGKWFYWNRIYLVKNERDMTIVSLNILQRLAKAISSLFGADYFAKVLKSIVGYRVKSYEPGAGNTLIKVSPSDFVSPHLILERYLITT